MQLFLLGIQGNLQYNQQQVYDIITRRFIGVFYPDSDVSNTSVIGKAADVPFKTTGKEILTKGWRVVFETNESKIKKEMNEKLTLPSFVKGEKGTHEPSFLEKETKPPRNFTLKQVYYVPWKLLESKLMMMKCAN